MAANEAAARETPAAEDRKAIKEQKKQLKKDLKEQKKEARRRAREIAKQEDDLDEEEGSSGGLATILTTIFIVVIWLAVICIVIKLDVGGFGSSVLTPILKDVPVVNKILPSASTTETTDEDAYGGYTSLEEAVDYITSLELQLQQAQTESSEKDSEIETLKAEITRLQPFEEKQVEFERISKEFYEEVVYAENGPGAEEYKKYYESMDESTAAYLYKQVVAELEESSEVQDYASAYAEMKPKDAAEIFDTMTDNLDLVAKILNAMTAEERGDILAEMDADVAAKLTKIMDPES